MWEEDTRLEISSGMHGRLLDVREALLVGSAMVRSDERPRTQIE